MSADPTPDLGFGPSFEVGVPVSVPLTVEDALHAASNCLTIDPESSEHGASYLVNRARALSAYAGARLAQAMVMSNERAEQRAEESLALHRRATTALGPVEAAYDLALTLDGLDVTTMDDRQCRKVLADVAAAAKAALR